MRERHRAPAGTVVDPVAQSWARQQFGGDAAGGAEIVMVCGQWRPLSEPGGDAGEVGGARFEFGGVAADVLALQFSLGAGAQVGAEQLADAAERTARFDDSLREVDHGAAGIGVSDAAIDGVAAVLGDDDFFAPPLHQERVAGRFAAVEFKAVGARDQAEVEFFEGVEFGCAVHGGFGSVRVGR